MYFFFFESRKLRFFKRVRVFYVYLHSLFFAIFDWLCSLLSSSTVFFLTVCAFPSAFCSERAMYITNNFFFHAIKTRNSRAYFALILAKPIELEKTQSQTGKNKFERA